MIAEQPRNKPVPVPRRLRWVATGSQRCRGARTSDSAPAAQETAQAMDPNAGNSVGRHGAEPSTASGQDLMAVDSP